MRGTTWRWLAVGVLATACGTSGLGGGTAEIRPLASRPPLARLTPMPLGSGGLLRELVAGAAGIGVELGAGKGAHVVLATTTSGPASITLSAETSARRGVRAQGVDRKAEVLPRFERPIQPFTAAPGGGERQLDATSANGPATFWLSRPGSDTKVQVGARRVYVGTRCEVYLDTRDMVPADNLAQLGQTFDGSIYPTTARIFGAPITPPGTSERIALLVSREVNDNGRESTLGYFSTADLLPADKAAAAHGNARMLLYLCADVVAYDVPAEMFGTVAHELEHLLNATRRAYGSASAREQEEGWLDEALAMYAMQANGYGMASESATALTHVAAYLGSPEAYSLTNWQLNPGGDGYGAAALWMTYVVDRFGEGIVRELVDGPSRGLANVDARLARRGTSFAQVFRDWAIANLAASLDLPTDPRFAYRSIRLVNSYPQGDLAGVAEVPLGAPVTRRITPLPWSAGYYDLQAAAGAAYSLSTDVAAGAFGLASYLLTN